MEFDHLLSTGDRQQEEAFMCLLNQSMVQSEESNIIITYISITMAPTSKKNVIMRSMVEYSWLLISKKATNVVIQTL